MAQLPKMLLRTGKIFLFSFGISISSVSLALGTIGKMYSTESKKFINTNISSANDTLNNITSSIKDFKEQFKTEDIEQIYQQLESLINEVENTLNEQKSTMQDAINKIQDQIDKTTDQNDKNTLTNAKSLLEELMNNIIGYPANSSKTSNDNNSTLFSILDSLKNIVNDKDSALSKDNIEATLNTIMNQTTSIINTYVVPIQNFTNSWNNEQKVDKTYDLVSTILLAFGGAMIGVNLIAYLFCLMLYKRVNGKLVGRASAKKDLKNHLDKLLKKYPYLKRELLEGR